MTFAPVSTSFKVNCLPIPVNQHAYLALQSKYTVIDSKILNEIFHSYKHAIGCAYNSFVIFRYVLIYFLLMSIRKTTKRYDHFISKKNQTDIPEVD